MPTLKAAWWNERLGRNNVPNLLPSLPLVLSSRNHSEHLVWSVNQKNEVSTVPHIHNARRIWVAIIRGCRWKFSSRILTGAFDSKVWPTGQWEADSKRKLWVAVYLSPPILLKSMNSVVLDAWWGKQRQSWTIWRYERYTGRLEYSQLKKANLKKQRKLKHIEAILINMLWFIAFFNQQNTSNKLIKHWRCHHDWCWKVYNLSGKLSG